jgi:hypothetical protein
MNRAASARVKLTQYMSGTSMLSSGKTFSTILQVHIIFRHLPRFSPGFSFAVLIEVLPI